METPATATATATMQMVESVEMATVAVVPVRIHLLKLL